MDETLDVRFWALMCSVAACRCMCPSVLAEPYFSHTGQVLLKLKRPGPIHTDQAKGGRSDEVMVPLPMLAADEEISD